MTARIVRSALSSVFLLYAVASGAADSMTVEQGWARATPPGAANGAAFMTLVNASAKDNALVSAESDAAGAVELHSHVMEDGVARMRQVPEVAVAAGSRTELRPGGLHIMLFGLKAPLVDGGRLAVTLKFRDGSIQKLMLPIRRDSHGGHGSH